MILGAHESISGGVFTAITRGQEAACETVQIFNKSNNQWKARKLDTDEVDQLFKLVDETGISVACSHASYLINIASPNQSLSRKSVTALKIEMQRCETLGINNLVMHPGSHTGSGEARGLTRVARHINRLFDSIPDNKVTLSLETTAGQGSTLGYCFEQLAEIFELVEDKNRIGVCLDTCHIFAAGYPISDPGDYKSTIRQFNKTVGIKKLKVIHLNDSKTDIGSRKDRHEHIGKGFIGKEGFRNMVNDRRLEKIPMVLETPKNEDLKDDVKNLKTLRALVKNSRPK